MTTTHDKCQYPGCGDIDCDAGSSCGKPMAAKIPPAVDVDAPAELSRQYEGMSRSWHKVAKHGGEWENCDALCEGHRNAIARAHLAPAPGVDAPSHAKMLDHVTEPAEPFRLDADSFRVRGITRWLGTLAAEQQAIGEIIGEVALRALAARNVLRQAQEKPDAQRPA